MTPQQTRRAHEVRRKAQAWLEAAEAEVEQEELVGDEAIFTPSEVQCQQAEAVIESVTHILEDSIYWLNLPDLKPRRQVVSGEHRTN